MKEYSNRTVIESLNLPMITSFNDLVEDLRLSEKLVFWITSDNLEGKYKTFCIPKYDGTSREINAPVLSVKIVQRWILENILYRIRTSPYSYGFKRIGRGSPLVCCAEKHKNNLFVLKMDLKNFYPSITRDKVYYQFVNIGYNTEVANLLTNVCVYNNRLPQGAVTSAYLANLICMKLDYRIAGYCNKRDIVYTRYADDMTFSCDNRDALRKIYGMINEIITDEGFLINKGKTQFMTPKCHKKVLGVTINDNLIKAPKVLKKTIRHMLHYQIATGDYSKNEQVRGYIAYVDSIENGYKDRIINYIKKLSQSTLSMFAENVKAFNSNKIYSELPDMIEKKPTDFVDYDDAEELSNYIYYEHQKYLISKGLIEDDG